MSLYFFSFPTLSPSEDFSLNVRFADLLSAVTGGKGGVFALEEQR